MKNPKSPRNPVFNSIATIDAFIAEGLAAGKSVVQMMSEVIPSIAEQREAKAAGIKERNEAATAKRLADRAARNAPARQAEQSRAYAARMARIAQKKAARLRGLEREAEKKAQAIAENPTLRWRTPRRKGWVPPAGYHGASS